MAGESWAVRIGRSAVLLIAAIAIIAVSSIVAAYLVGRQFAELVHRRAPVGEPHRQNADVPVADFDFYEATGIGPEQLRQFLQKIARDDHLDSYPAHLTFTNDQGDCLVDFPVEIAWEGGRDRVTIGRSGVLRIMLRAELLPGLKFHVPREYRHVKQHTLPLGAAYEPYPVDDDDGPGRHVVDDYRVAMEIWMHLARRRPAEGVLGPDRWREQIRRTRCDWRPRVIDDSETGNSASIYRRRREAVVVIGHLLPGGGVTYAGGVVLDSEGVIATAYHVVDKPDAVSRCVMTADGKTYPIREILAADRARDVALIRIDARGLAAAPLSHGDDEGAALTILSHPSGEFYSVMEGRLRRYQAAVIYGRQVVQMAVTADFAEGASGGPVFNEQGAVAGVVSFRRPGAGSDAAHIASPAQAIRELSSPIE